MIPAPIAMLNFSKESIVNGVSSSELKIYKTVNVAIVKINNMGIVYIDTFQHKVESGVLLLRLAYL